MSFPNFNTNSNISTTVIYTRSSYFTVGWPLESTAVFHQYMRYLQQWLRFSDYPFKRCSWIKYLYAHMFTLIKYVSFIIITHKNNFHILVLTIIFIIFKHTGILVIQWVLRNTGKQWVFVTPRSSSSPKHCLCELWFESW